MGATLRLLALGVLSAGFATACTNILGKFKSNGGAGASGAGTGGTVGSGGGQPATEFDCTWKASAHQQIATTELTPNASFGRAVLVASDQDRALMFVRFSPPMAESQLQIVNPSDPNMTSKVPMRELLSARRLSKQSTGALFVTNAAAGKFEVRMLELTDGQALGQAISYLVVPMTDWAVAASDQRFSGDFAVRDDAPNQWKIDVVVTYHDIGGKYLERYVHYTPGLGGSTVLTDPTVSLKSEDVEVESLAWVPSVKKSFAYIGNSNGGTVREYAVDATTVGPVKARTVGPVVMLDTAARSDGFNVALAEIASLPIKLHAQKLAVEKIGDFKPGDVGVASTFTATDDLPVNDATIRWTGEVLLMLGGQGLKNLDIGYRFFDSASRARGDGTLPFTVKLDASRTRNHLDGVAWATTSTTFDKIGGELMVGWAESQSKSGVEYSVVYFDHLKCVTVDPG